MSMPQTPTQGSRYRHGHGLSSGNAYIEVAASPRRTPGITHEREGSVYRPRSREGTGIPRRVSGESSGASNGAATPARSRLPRTSLSYSRSSFSGQGPPVISRSESAMSNKENAGRAAAGSGPGSPAVGKRRARAPSDAKW